jgi:hypothetical protein
MKIIGICIRETPDGAEWSLNFVRDPNTPGETKDSGKSETVNAAILAAASAAIAVSSMSEPAK